MLSQARLVSLAAPTPRSGTGCGSRMRILHWACALVRLFAAVLAGTADLG